MRPLSAFSLFLLSILISHSSFSIAEGLAGSKEIQFLINAYPNTNFKRAAVDYIKIIAPELYNSGVGQDNRGLQKLVVDKFNESESFQNDSISFYQDVAKYWAERIKEPSETLDEENHYACRDDGQGTPPFAISYQCEKDRARILLTEAAGTNMNKDYEPGWLWKLALKNANGDPNRAMDIIGLCGHDNRFQGAKAFINKETGQKTFLNCPDGSSPFFVPQALHKEADISNNLKKKIQELQNPYGNSKIPAKYYHIMGEAFVSCQLIQKGHSAEDVIEVAKLAARVYRSIYLWQKISPYMEIKNALALPINISGIDDIKKFIEKKMLTCNPEQPPNVINKKPCDTLKWQFGERFSNASALEKKQIVTEIINLIDATTLYQTWYIPFTDIRLFGPDDIANSKNSWYSQLIQPDGWSNERYERAKYILATWDIDFKWTVAQHEAGAKFAASVCKRIN